MCQGLQQEIKAYYISEDILEIQLPLDNLPELGDIPEQGICAYILISNGEEITLITDIEEYNQWLETQN